MRSKKLLLTLLLLLSSSRASGQVLIALLFGETLNTGKIEFGLDGGLNLVSLDGVDQAEMSEGMADGQEFIRTARQVTQKKPVVAIKSGVTQSGSRAVSSHTGSLAGSEQAYQPAFLQAGVLRADSMQSLFDIALALAYQRLLQGDRVAIITNAGGPGILATDALERAGMSLARFRNETIAALQKYLPDAASAANPVDVLGDARADRYRFALEQVTADPNVDGLLVVLTPQAMTDSFTAISAVVSASGLMPL